MDQHTAKAMFRLLDDAADRADSARGEWGDDPDSLDYAVGKALDARDLLNEFIDAYKRANRGGPMDADQLRKLWAKRAQEHAVDEAVDAAEVYGEALWLLGEDTNTRYARDVIALRAAFYRDLLADIDRTA